MGIDGGLRALFHKALRPYGAHCQSIETGGTGKGIPDTNICLNGIEVWIEFKKTSANAVKLEIEQSAWLEQRTRVGGRCFVAVRKKRNSSARLKATDELWIFKGQDATSLREGGLKSVMPVAIYRDGPTKWDWLDVKEVIFQ